jgi:hypothetical protein
MRTKKVFPCRPLLSLHRDQRGALSILSVFAALLLTMLLGMVMNVGRQVDGKLRMQNAADAAAYSGAVVQARAMNSLALTNHLLCEVFALTAILREGRDRNAESFVPRILVAWGTQPPEFARSRFPKFIDLGKALQKKLPQEQQLVTTYSRWMAAVSAIQLPIFEEVLRQELIPNYQRAVRQAFPAWAQAVAGEVARRGGTPDFGRGAMRAALWQPGSGDSASPEIALPVADPREDGAYRGAAQSQRTTWANHYLDQWTNLQMAFFDSYGKLGQFGRLWRGFTCGQLQKLIAEYPDSNLPSQVLDVPGDPSQRQAYLREHFAIVGVVSWNKLAEFAPKVFQNSTENDALAYAEAHVFVPQPNLVFVRSDGSTGSDDTRVGLGGVPGNFPTVSLPDQTPENPPGAGSPGPTGMTVGRQSVPIAWDLFNQHWSCQLTPAPGADVAAVLHEVLPNLRNLRQEDMDRISWH